MNDENIVQTELPRNIRDGPFAWVNKKALRLIRETFDTSNTVSSALGVYHAMAEIASDQQSPFFRTTHAWIAQKCGESPSTVKKRLKELADIKLLEIITPPRRAPCFYSMLQVRQPLPNESQPLTNDRQPTENAALATLEQSNEIISQQGGNNSDTDTDPPNGELSLILGNDGRLMTPEAALAAWKKALAEEGLA